MIYEYAVDPACFSNIDKVIFLLESFGRDKGRLISEIKKGHWVDLVRRSIHNTGNQDVARKRLIEALNILVKKQKSLYRRQQQVEECVDWLSMTQRAHSAWPYRGILLEEYNGHDPHYLVRDIHLSGKSNWAVPPSLTIDREAASMVAAISSLLENAREVILVDRNFRLVNQHGSPVGRYKNVLLGIAGFLGNKQYGPSVGKLAYHIGDEYYDVVNIKDQFNRYLRASFPADFKLEFTIWPKHELHARFILTDIGGGTYDPGLDEYAGTGQQTVLIERISCTDHAREWARFKQKAADVVLP
jgi:hypothetical protein